jgi:hypothetical protein
MTLGLTQRIADGVARQGRYNGTSRALDVALGAMIAHDTAHGASAFAGVDVERLFSAIQMLAQRETLEVAPFVAAWNASLEEVGRARGLSSGFKRQFAKELLEGVGDSGFERIFREGVDTFTGRGSQNIFQRLEVEMVAALRSAVHVDEIRVDYLKPIFDISWPTRIATLNYDRSIEILARRSGLSLTTGIENWSGGFDWNWADDADVRLLKLHGSIDWWFEDGPSTQERRLREPKVVVDDASEGSGRPWNSRPAVVFGQRGKLRSDGPFLAILNGFQNMLNETRRLVIVGYSFRDEHINALVRRWLNEFDESEIVIIDPGLNVESVRHDGTFRSELIRTITKWGTGTTSRREVVQPHHILNTPASEGLARLLEPPLTG